MLSTKQFEVLETSAILQPMLEGTRPIFTKYKYDTLGREMKEKVPKGEEPEQEQSFIRKYWMYMLIAFVLFNSLLGG